MPIHLPPEKVTLQSQPAVKLTHLIFRLRQQLPPRMQVSVYSKRVEVKPNEFEFERGVYVHDVMTNLEYVPELRMDDLRVVGDVDALSEEMVKDIKAAFEHGEEEFLADE